MSNAIPTVPAKATDDAILAALDEFGGVIVEDFLSPEVLDLFNRELNELVDAERNKQQQFPNEAIAGFFGDKVTHVSGVAGKSPAFVEHVLCHPRYLSICDHVLLPNCADYQLNIAHVMEREPGSEAQFLHRDEWVWKRLPPMDGDVQLASLVALVDFTADNGATLVVPGSHRWEQDRYPKPEEAVPAEMKAGSAVIYLGRTFHGGGANITRDSVRRGMHVSYSVGWLRTEENSCLSTPLDVVRKMPERAQTLLGFGMHDDLENGGGYLGTVELTAPHKLL
ncbi:MAG: phytanoyl-CoA dioxygenase family protein [Deltaproteobacteria bacterium]|nr:phytanoyl-CoA dioxygenase family protein [Deltaproteobacteria bacterium]